MYQNLVKTVVLSLRNAFQKYCDTEDIINEATIALMSAIDSFDVSKNVKFESYASLKIRGAIIDYVRKQDLVPRGVRKFSKELDTGYSELFSKLNRIPTSDELAEHLNISKEKLNERMADIAAASTLSFEDMMINGDNDISSSDDSVGIWDVEKRLFSEEKRKVLIHAIEGLNEQQRLVISLYYKENLKFSDIAKVLQVSEARVCQIHSKAMLTLKYELQKYINN